MLAIQGNITEQGWELEVLNTFRKCLAVSKAFPFPISISNFHGCHSLENTNVSEKGKNTGNLTEEKAAREICYPLVTVHENSLQAKFVGYLKL